MKRMWRIVSILLCLGVAVFASTVLQTLHEMDHEREDAAAAQEAGNSRGTPAPHHHSEDDCPICRQIHMPLAAMAPHSWLVQAGEWVPFVTMLAVSQRSQAFPGRIACRGPPEC